MRLVSITALVLGVVTPLGAVPAASAAAPTCAGVKATIVGNAQDNRIKGTPRRDVIVAGGGNDTIRGLGGNDLVCGGEGADKIFGGPGDDRLFGEADAYWADPYGRVRRVGDTLVPGEGDDRVDPGADPRPVSAGVTAVPDGVSFSGAPTGLVINLRVSPVVTTAEGTDSIVTIPTGMRLIGTQHADTVFGTNSADWISLRDGDDKAFGNGGDDTISADGSGPAGNDTVVGGAGDDTLTGSLGSDMFVGGTGQDRLSSTSVLHQVFRGGGGADTVTFPLPVESGFVAKGHGGQDRLRLLANPNPAVKARVRLDQKRGRTKVRDLVPTSLEGTIDGFSDVYLPGRATTIYKGTNDSEIITADLDHRAQIYGRGGADVLIGSNEPDRLEGGAGFDIARGKKGNDTCRSAERRSSC